MELFAAILASGMGKQPPSFDPGSHKHGLAKTHGQFRGSAALLGHGRFACRGQCPDWDDVARSCLPPDPRLGTADAFALWHLAMGVGAILLAAGSCLGASRQHGTCARMDHACCFRFGALPRRRARSAAHLWELRRTTHQPTRHPCTLGDACRGMDAWKFGAAPLRTM